MYYCYFFFNNFFYFFFNLFIYSFFIMAIITNIFMHYCYQCLSVCQSCRVMVEFLWPLTLKYERGSDEEGGEVERGGSEGVRKREKGSERGVRE